MKLHKELIEENEIMLWFVLLDVINKEYLNVFLSLAHGQCTQESWMGERGVGRGVFEIL